MTNVAPSETSFPLDTRQWPLSTFIRFVDPSALGHVTSTDADSFQRDDLGRGLFAAPVT